MSVSTAVRLIAWLAVASSPLLGAAEIVEVTLTNDTVVMGDLVNDSPTELGIKHTVQNKNGTMSYTQTIPRADVKTVAKVEDAYKARAGATPATADDQLALATWCRERLLNDQAALHAQKVLALDPGNAKARSLLLSIQYVPVDGKWVKADDYLISHGLLRIDGLIIFASDKDKVQISFAQRQTAQREYESKNRGVTELDSAITLAKARIETLNKEKATLTEKAKTADADAAKLDGLKKAYEAAEANVQKASDAAANANNNNNNNNNNGGAGTTGGAGGGGKKGGRKGGAGGNPATNLANAQTAATKAKKDYSDALAASHSSSPASIKARLAAIDKEVADQNDLITADEMKKPDAQKDADAAKAKWDEAKKKTDDLIAGLRKPDLPPEFAELK